MKSYLKTGGNNGIQRAIEKPRYTWGTIGKEARIYSVNGIKMGGGEISAESRGFTENSRDTECVL